MVSFHIDLDGLSGAIKDMRQFDTWAEETIARLDHVITNLHVEWLGAAAGEQQRAHQHWINGARKMREAVAELHAAGTGAHGNYTATGDGNLTMWGG